MSRKAAEQAKQTESGDQQGASVTSRRGEPLQVILFSLFSLVRYVFDSLLATYIYACFTFQGDDQQKVA